MSHFFFFIYKVMDPIRKYRLPIWSNPLFIDYLKLEKKKKKETRKIRWSLPLHQSGSFGFGLHTSTNTFYIQRSTQPKPYPICFHQIKVPLLVGIAQQKYTIDNHMQYHTWEDTKFYIVRQFEPALILRLVLHTGVRVTFTSLPDKA